jgi:maltose alpha-D-glucosyltransferase/alpha-amylase
MQWDDGKNAGFSSVNPDELYAPLIDDDEFSYKSVNVAAEVGNPHSLLNKMRHLITVRKSNPIFALGEYQFMAQEHTQCLCILRTYNGENVFCALNLTDAQQSLSVDLAQFHGKQLINLMDGKAYGRVTDTQTPINLLPFGFLWLLIK